MISLYDTKILIDYLNGIEQAAVDIEAHAGRAISRITWIEVLAGARGDAEERQTRQFLSQFNLIDISGLVADQAIRVRRDRRLKLPDAIIYATAAELQGELVTRNTRDFPSNDPIVRIPYSL